MTGFVAYNGLVNLHEKKLRGEELLRILISETGISLKTNEGINNAKFDKFDSFSHLIPILDSTQNGKSTKANKVNNIKFSNFDSFCDLTQSLEM